MEMENKKISFGFLKTKKKEEPVITEQREYIESVEENAIKLIGNATSKEVEPLIIPMKPNTLITTERLKEIAEKVESSLIQGKVEDKIENQINTQNNLENETLDQIAVRELLQEAKREMKQDIKSLKITITSNPVLVGQKESSLDDYEAVPVQEFGMAMLRGMGWTPEIEKSNYKLPNLRPKGLGLGADKVITEKQKNVKRGNDVDLAIVKNASVKITNGKYCGCYGKVISLDEDNGRVLVNIPIKSETISLNEFMVQPVPKSEFDKNSKVINADTYEIYKKNEKSKQKSSSNNSTETASSSSHKSKHADSIHRNEKRNNEILPSQKDKEELINGKSKDYRRNRGSSRSDDVSCKNKRQDKKRYSSNDSLSSDTDTKRRKEEYIHHSSSDNEKDRSTKCRGGSGKEKRDIDKKRKGKKKKRDRDRSPGYRKYKK